MEEINRIFSNNLKNLMNKNEKQQADLARDLNLSKATISSWISGTRTPRMDKIDMLCAYFKCTRSEIIGSGLSSFVVSNDSSSYLVDSYNELNEEQQRHIVEMIAFYLEKNRKDNQ